MLEAAQQLDAIMKPIFFDELFQNAYFLSVTPYYKVRIGVFVKHYGYNVNKKIYSFLHGQPRDADYINPIYRIPESWIRLKFIRVNRIRYRETSVRIYFGSQSEVYGRRPSTAAQRLSLFLLLLDLST